MTRSIRLILTLACAAVTAASLALPAGAGPQAPSVPGTIAVEDGHKVFLVGHAVGDQIYSGNAVGGGYAWGFVGPRADLFDDSGKLIATHFGGPTWQARDGSWVKAQRVDGVKVDAGAIDWLLLKVSSQSAGSDGDRLVATTFIQRINTVGGIAPAAAGCNADTVGTIVPVAYEADYYFWKATA